MLYGTTNLFLVLFILECQIKEMMCLNSLDVILRFFVFYMPIIRILQHKTFASCEIIERAVLMKNLRKDSAELLEALLILSCKLKTNMLNKQHETRRLRSLNIEAEDFAERLFFIYLFCKIFKIQIKRFHQMAVQLLYNNWEELYWEQCQIVSLFERKK